MIKKLFTKYFLEVVPSIVATVVGAYIVTHYINAKSDADKPKAAIATPDEASRNAAPLGLKADEASEKAAKESAKAEAARLKAEKLALEKAAAERSAADRAENVKRAAEKMAAEKAASEKAFADKLAAEKKPVAKSALASPSPSEVNAGPDDKRDANNLVRAAIERLRSAKTREKTIELPRTSEAMHAEEQPGKADRAKVNSVVYAPPPAVQPLPPAVTVAAPSEVAVAPPSPFPQPIAAASADSRVDDGMRLTPPADIPSRPLDVRAKEGRTSVTEDVVSAARSVFHAVVPDSSN